MRWWISFEVDEAPRAGTPVGDAIQALYTALNSYGSWLEGEDAGIEPDKLITYLEAWGDQMTTMKARTTASWAANTVARAVKQPGLLDQLPTPTPIPPACSTCEDTRVVRMEGQIGTPGLGGELPCPDCTGRFGECSWHPGEYHGICSEAAR